MSEAIHAFLIEVGIFTVCFTVALATSAGWHTGKMLVVGRDKR